MHVELAQRKGGIKQQASFRRPIGKFDGNRVAAAVAHGESWPRGRANLQRASGYDAIKKTTKKRAHVILRTWS